MVIPKTYQTLLLYLLLIIVVVVYTPSLTFEPLSWNDDTAVTSADAVRSGSASVWNNAKFRPIPLEIFSYLRSYGNGSIFLFHLINILLHISNIIGICYLLLRFRQTFTVIILLAALFGLHPLFSAAVSRISEFPMIASLTVLLISAHLYLSYRRTEKKRYLWAVALSASVFHLTVTGGFEFVVMMFGIDFAEQKKFTKEMAYEKIPFVVLSLLSGFIAHISVINAFNDSLQFVRFGIVEGFLKIVMISHSSGITPLQDILSKNMFFGLNIYPFIVPFIIFLVFWMNDNKKIFMFSGLGFMLFGLPIFSWSLGGEWILNSENYYICILFFLYPICVLTVGDFEKIQPQIIFRAGRGVVMVSILIICTYQTTLTSYYRKTDISFWNQLKTEYPTNAFILNKIGTYYYSKYQSEKAIPLLTQSIINHPFHLESYNNRGLAYVSLYQTDSAIADFNKAISLSPSFALSYYNLSTVYNLLSDWEKTIANCNQAIELQPDFVQAYNNRANTFAKQKKYVQAFADYESAISIDPSYLDIYGNRALIFLETGNATESLKNFKKQSELAPKRFDILIHLGLTSIIVKDTIMALFAISNAAKLDSANSKMYLSAVQQTFLRNSDDFLLLNEILRKAALGK